MSSRRARVVAAASKCGEPRHHAATMCWRAAELVRGAHGETCTNMSSRGLRRTFCVFSAYLGASTCTLMTDAMCTFCMLASTMGVLSTISGQNFVPWTPAAASQWLAAIL